LRQTPTTPPSTTFPYTTLFRSSTQQQQNADRGTPDSHLFRGCKVNSERPALNSSRRSPREVVGSGGRELRVGSGELLMSYCARKDRKSTRLNSSHVSISYAVFC